MRGRAHLEQPLAHRQVAHLAGDVHGSVAVVARLGDVRGRAHLEQPLAHRPVALWQATYMGVTPLLFALVMSAAAPTSNSHLHTDRWPSPGGDHGSDAFVVRLADVRGRAHLEQHAHRQVALLTGDPHGSEAAVIRLGDVRGRAHLEQPIEKRKVAHRAGDAHGSGAVGVRLGDVRVGARIIVEPFAHIQLALPASFREREQIWPFVI